MKCIVSGGTGFIGRRVVSSLLERQHSVVVWSRKPATVNSFTWDPMAGEPTLLEGMNAVVHLAGETVAQRWTPDVKKRIRDSRVLGTRNLVAAIGKVKQKPQVLVCASAIGFYGDRGNEVLTETSASGPGFLPQVCREWEAEADRAAQFGLRVVKLRIGFVLGLDGGALGQMLPVFRAGVGGRLGSGKQWMPWVHVDDVTSLIVHGVESDIAGVWNATAPNPVTNSDFTAMLGSALHRPAVIPVPGFALKLMFGEFGQHMLDSARVIPAAATAAGYRFRYPELPAALAALLASKP